MAVGTTNYPASLDTVVELVEAANNAADQLNGNISNSATSLTLMDGSEFAQSGIVAIDNELLSYTSRTGNTLNGLVRGIEGTTAASHTDMSAVRQVITAASHNVQSAAIIALETKLGTGTDIAWAKMAPLATNRILVSDSGGDVTVSPLTLDATNGIVGNVGGVDFDTTPTGTIQTARLQWNDTDGTLALGLKGGAVTLQVGQEHLTRIINKTGDDLLESEFRVIRAGASAGVNRIGGYLAQADSEANSTDVLGIVTENIAKNQEGFVTTWGEVRQIDTTGAVYGETWNEGDTLYLSPSTYGGKAGALTNVKPKGPDHLVVIGYVISKNANNGRILVHVQSSWETAELHDVKITGTPAAGSLLIRNATTGVWENATLTAGSNITITNADKSITINSTASGSGDVVGPSSATDNALARFDTTTGKLIQNSLITLSDAGALSFPDGVRQTFNPNGTNAGINVGAHTSDPSSPTNGDLWYNSTANQLKTRRGAATEVVATIPSNLGDEIPVLNATTGNLSATGQVFWDGSGNALQVGNTSTGALRLVNATGTDSFTLRPPASGGAVALTLPPGIGSIGQALTSDGTGGTSWSTITAGVSSVSGTSPVVSSGGSTPAISLASGYGDTQNPYASKTANNFLAAPNGTAGAPTFRAIVAADIPTLNQNTTGTASNVTGTVAIANGGTGATTASAARTNLGATTVGSNLFTLTNPSAITFPRFNADNTVSALNAADFRTAIGAGTGNGTVTSVTGTSPVASSGGTTPAISLNAAYGDTLNPYSTKTANNVLAGPTTGAAAAPTFRALVDDDIPNTLTVSKISNLTSNGFVKTSAGDGTLSVDTNTYLTGNQTITLSGDVSGSGTTAITTAIGASKVTNTMLAGSIAASKLVGTDIATVGTITSGTWNGTTIAVANGGTGQTSYTDGQLLIGNTATGGLSKATLTAGSGVTITNGNGSISIASAGGGGGSNSTVDGRLTLTSGTPVTTSDVTGATTVYYTPYVGNGIALFDGTSTWTVRTFSELSLSLSGFTANTNYDIFAYWTGSAVALEAESWGTNTAYSGTGLACSAATSAVITLPSSVTGSNPFTTSSVVCIQGATGTNASVINDTYRVTATGGSSGAYTITLGFVNTSSGAPTMTGASIRANDNVRATSLTYQNGVLVKSGATTRRYLGTIRIGGTAGQTEDSDLRRFVWNANNRRKRRMYRAPTASSWTYASVPNGDVWSALNSDAANRIQAILGYVEDPISMQSAHSYDANGTTGNVYGLAGISINGILRNDAGASGTPGVQYLTQISNAVDTGPAYATLQDNQLGYNFYTHLQCPYHSASSGTALVRFYGQFTTGVGPLRQSGILGEALM